MKPPDTISVSKNFQNVMEGIKNIAKKMPKAGIKENPEMPTSNLQPNNSTIMQQKNSGQAPPGTSISSGSHNSRVTHLSDVGHVDLSTSAITTTELSLSCSVAPKPHISIITQHTSSQPVNMSTVVTTATTICNQVSTPLSVPQNTSITQNIINCASLYGNAQQVHANTTATTLPSISAPGSTTLTTPTGIMPKFCKFPFDNSIVDHHSKKVNNKDISMY
jgi:hypothetical protein